MLARLFRDLAAYEPTLVGTFPLGLATWTSDVDIACFAPDLVSFEHVLRASLAGLEARIDRLPGESGASLASFTHEGTAFEIFAQPVPVYAQAGFRHMIVEGRLLALGGHALRERVVAAKRAGMKTEPAFAHALALPGDPALAVLALESASDATLRRLIAPTPREATITLHAGDRTGLLPLFRIADDSEAAVASYLALGEILVAMVDGAPAGHVQLIAADHALELKSLAVVPGHRAAGLGRRLVEAALDHARSCGALRVVLSTATADASLLRFYQRRGFRMTHIDPDIFTPANGYPPGLEADGIPLRDRVWFEIVLR
ncbi:MAG: GNAT family N-acetyltransferase [Kofleriaceae bacterium]